MAPSQKKNDTKAAGKYVYYRTSFAWPQDTHKQIREFMERQRMKFFSEAVMRLIVEGLALEKIEPRKWNDDDFAFDKRGGVTVTIAFPKHVYDPWRDWRHKHKVDAGSDAVIALVRRALEEETGKK